MSTSATCSALSECPRCVAACPYALREEAAYITARIPGARRFEVPGPDVAIYLQTETLLPEVERFVATLGSRSRIPSSPPSCSPTSSAPPRSCRSSAMPAGVNSWSAIMRSFVSSSAASADARSTRQATAFLRPSTARSEQSRCPSAIPRARLVTAPDRDPRPPRVGECELVGEEDRRSRRSISAPGSQRKQARARY